MPLLSALIPALDRIAPLRDAETWDNVGLLWGDEKREITNVLVCIDYTRAVADEAREQKAELVIAYHPAIFSGMKRVPGQSLVYEAIRDGIALYSPHTALDVAQGGTNDVLGDIVGMTARMPLRRPDVPDRSKKLVTFVPEDAVEKVADALFAAGAGVIGNYTACSFRTQGEGTFFGEEGSQPKVGKAGQRESAKEVRLETVVTDKVLPAVLAALMQAHPYETPAFDLVRLAEPPSTRGIGRIGACDLDKSAIISKLKEGLGVSHVMVAGSLTGKCKRIAVAAGAGAELLDDAIKQKADVFVTGELKHHDALKANARGVTVITTLHSNSERAALAAYARNLENAVPGLTVRQSARDADPFSIQ